MILSPNHINSSPTEYCPEYVLNSCISSACIQLQITYFSLNVKKKGGLAEEMVQKCLNPSSTITGYVVIQQIFYFPKHNIYSEFRMFMRGFIYTPQTKHNMGIIYV